MKVIANYTEVYKIDKDGNQSLYCFFINQYGLANQLATLLLELRNKSWLPYYTMDGQKIDPLKEAESEVVLTGMSPMPRGFIEHEGNCYFGHVREYKEIEIKDIKQ